MAKLALLIGVSEYEPGLKHLPGSVKDIEAMQRVLQDPDMGGFEEVKTLQNPEPLVMEEAIQNLFTERTKDDLVLFFFSGHGIKDERGKLYFSTRLTRKTIKGELMKATAVPASFVQDIMSDSRSRRQIIILDCCFSGAFAEGLSSKDDGNVDVKSQLSGGKEVAEGRVVLTSSTSTQYSFEQQGSELSTYTRYLVEGVETGAADKGDGEISIDELHEYAKSKVQESAPAMKPEIYAAKEGYKIVLAKAPTSDPKLMYQRQVENICKKHKGEIPPVSRSKLDALRVKLGLSSEDAAASEARVLKPYQDYKRKVEQYAQTLRLAFQDNKVLDNDTVNDLKDYQQTLGLRDEDVEPVEIKILGRSLKQKIIKSSSFIEFFKGLISQKKNVKFPSQGTVFSYSKFYLPLLSVIGITTLIILGFVGNYTLSRIKYEQLYRQGEESLKKEDFREAVNNFEQAIKIDGNSAKAYVGLGKARAKNGNVEGAISNFNIAIRLNEKYAEAYYNRGLAQQEIGKYSEALGDYSKAIEMDTKHLESRLKRANLYFKEGKNEAAIIDYDQVIRLDRKLAEAYFGRCMALYDVGKYSEAVNSCTQAIEKDHEKKLTASAYFNRAISFQQKGDIEAALRDYNQAIVQDHRSWGSYNYRGLIYKDRGDYSQALEDFTNAIENYPKSGNKTALAMIYVNRANTRLQMPKPDVTLAINDFLSANVLDGNYAPAWEAMGDLLARYDRLYIDGRRASDFYSKAASLYSSQNQQINYRRALEKSLR